MWTEIAVTDVNKSKLIYSVYQKNLSTMFERWFLTKFLLNRCDSYIK